MFLFCELQEVEGIFFCYDKKCSNISGNTFSRTNIFLLTLAHSSKKSPEGFVFMNWTHGILLQGLRKKERHVCNPYRIASMKIIEFRELLHKWRQD